MIDSPSQARRLASALAADLAVFDTDALRVGGDVREALAADIADARRVYEQAVAPPLWPLFDATVIPYLESHVGSAAPRDAVDLVVHERDVDAPPAVERPATTRGAGRGPVVRSLVFVVSAAVAAAIVILLLR